MSWSSTDFFFCGEVMGGGGGEGKNMKGENGGGGKQA